MARPTQLLVNTVSALHFNLHAGFFFPLNHIAEIVMQGLSRGMPFLYALLLSENIGLFP